MAARAQLSEIDRSLEHGLSPRQNCADRGRQNFIFHVKRKLAAINNQGLHTVAQHRSGVEDPTREQSEEALTGSAPFAAWSALNIGAQRQMWVALGDMIDRQYDDLERRRQALETRSKQGSLEIDPAFEMPRYLLDYAFHGQPGGYIDNRGDTDIRAGVLQEAGGALYSRGIGSGLRDSKAQAVLRYLNEQFPGLSPKRILDLACGHGSQTCGYAAAFPEAETHGVDAGEALLRFAHYKSESLGIPLHLHQQDAARTGFEDGSFDLVVSNILLHEVPTDVLEQIMVECWRLLAPGGVVIHQDVPTQKPDMPGFRKFMAMWQTEHNDEPYWERFCNTSVPEALIAAGFNRAHTFEDYVPQLAGPLLWYFVGAQKV